MELTIVKDTNLYCTFTEADVNKYFSLSFDEFSKNRKLVERFADILIDKAIKTGKLVSNVGQTYNICLYQTGETEYSIYLKKADYNFW